VECRCEIDHYGGQRFTSDGHLYIRRSVAQHARNIVPGTAVVIAAAVVAKRCSQVRLTGMPPRCDCDATATKPVNQPVMSQFRHILFTNIDFPSCFFPLYFSKFSF